ncbi:MAG TPA: 2-hydroxyacyl-CoA dehydratase family protein [Myxococcota bacterium]|nr:2-hydroxyacyl-CoA dehydratase family protein [Myxococcota bacterium]
MIGAATRKDSVYLRWAARNWLRILRLGVNPGPARMLKIRKRYPWVSGFLKVNKLMARLMGERRGAYRQATGFIINRLIDALATIVRDIHRRRDRLVWHEDLVPPEILHAMGLMPFMVEMLGIVLPMVDTELGEAYLDEAENAGLPADTCTLPRMSLGLALRDHFPPPLAIVSSNSPCDGGMSSYAFMQKLSGAPTYRLDLPYRYKDDSAVDYYTNELVKMIDFLEEHTPGRLDDEHLREICTQRNRAMELELTLWDMLRHKPAPLGSDVVFLAHMLFFGLFPGMPQATKMYAGLVEYARQSLQAGGGIPDEKYRVLLWNPATLIFPEIFSWAESEFRATMIMEMLTFNRHPLIDTTSRRSMLRDLARIMMQGPMSQHTRGPVEYFFDDLFFIHEHYSTDMIWMAGHVGCKNTQALLGMMREKCRQKRIPLLTIDYDLGDSRVVSVDGIKEQVRMFMDTVMR